MGTSYLPLTHTRSPTCVQTSLASWHIQTPVTQVLHHFLHELRFEPRPCPAPKCKVRKPANTVFVKTRRINCRHGVLRTSIHHRSTQAAIPPSTYCRICYNSSHLNAPIRMQRSSSAIAQRHVCGILQKTHAFPQQVLHYALPPQRRNHHVPNSSNISNGAGASKAPTNPAHCTNHLLPTSPIQVCCSLKNCVRFPHKTLSWPVHVCPKFSYSGDPRSAIYGIYWCPENCPLPQRYPASRTMPIRDR